MTGVSIQKVILRVISVLATAKRPVVQGQVRALGILSQVLIPKLNC